MPPKLLKNARKQSVSHTDLTSTSAKKKRKAEEEEELEFLNFTSDDEVFESKGANKKKTMYGNILFNNKMIPPNINANTAIN